MGRCEWPGGPGAGSQEPGARSLEPGAGGQEPGVRSRGPGARGQEVGGARMEITLSGAWMEAPLLWGSRGTSRCGGHGQVTLAGGNQEDACNTLPCPGHLGGWMSCITGVPVWRSLRR